MSDYEDGYKDGRKAAARDIRSMPARKWGDWLFRRAAVNVAENGRSAEPWQQTTCAWCEQDTTGRQFYCLCGARVPDVQYTHGPCLRNTNDPCSCEVCSR